MEIDSTALIIVGISGLAGILIGEHLARWLLQIYYHLDSLNRDKYLKLYDRFASKQAFEFLSKIQNDLPDTYKAYSAFHEANRQVAYLHYNRYLISLALRSLAVLLIALTIPVLLAESHHFFYLTFLIVLLLHIIYKVLKQKQGRKFNHLAVMGVVLLKIHKSYGD